MQVPYFIEDKIKVGIYGFTGCAGDQLVIIHDEARLLEYFQAADIRSFVMANSEHDEESELDVAIVEGSINTEDEIEELRHIRAKSKILVAIGSCAVHGGIQAGFSSEKEWKAAYDRIYGDTITLTMAHEPKPAAAYVDVDVNIPGCPIDPDQIYDAFARLVHGLPPEIENRPVCDICKLRENVCLLEKGELCLGPITATGCKAACPSNNIVCMGCYGHYEGANIKGFIDHAVSLGFDRDEVIRRIRCHGGMTFRSKLKELEIIKEEVV